MTLWSRITSVWRLAEDALGGLLAFITAVTFLLAVIMIGADTATHAWLGGWRYVIVCSVCILEILHLWSMKKSLAYRPFPLHVAMHLPKIPLLLRPVVCLFWTFHLLCALSAVWAAQSFFVTSTLYIRVGATVLAGILSFWAYGYLLLALATLRRDARLLGVVWHRRSWYLVFVGLVAMVLPYTGFIASHRTHVDIPTPGRIVAAGDGDDVALSLTIRNGEDEDIRVLHRVGWDDFRVTIRTPSGVEIKRRTNFFLRGFSRVDEDYVTVPAGSTQPFCTLTFQPGALLGDGSWWAFPLNAAARDLPFTEVGTYHVSLSYMDMGGSAHGALTGLSPVAFRVAIE